MAALLHEAPPVPGQSHTALPDATRLLIGYADRPVEVGDWVHTSCCRAAAAVCDFLIAATAGTAALTLKESYDLLMGN